MEALSSIFHSWRRIAPNPASCYQTSSLTKEISGREAFQITVVLA